ncbi:unnamed protein product, partial [Polarella glacialis]
MQSIPGSACWSLFVQYPNREPVLRELLPTQNVTELRNALEVLEDQQLLIQGNSGQYCQVEQVGQIYDGASLRVTVPRRRIFVSMVGGVRNRPIVWYPGTSDEQIESAIVKACGLPIASGIEVLDGDSTVVISASIPNDTHLTVVALPGHHANGGAWPSDRSMNAESPRRRAAAVGPRNGVALAPTRGLMGPAVAGARSSGPPSTSRTRSTTPGGGISSTQRVSAGAAHHGSPREAGRGVSPTRSAVTPQAGAGGSQSSGRRHGGAVAEAGAQGQHPPGTPSVPADLSALPPGGKSSAPEEHCVHILAGHNGFVLSLCTVGDVLFTGSQDCNIMIWDLNNLQYIGTLPGHRGFVKCMAATLTRKVLCSGSQDKTIKVWSLETFSSTKTLSGHTSE